MKSDVEVVGSLSYYALRTVALLMFKKQVRWRKLTDVQRTLKDEMNLLRLPIKLKRLLHQAIAQVLGEMQRWAEKHAEMFVDHPVKKFRAHRSEHLRTFHPCVVWKEGKYEIDDLATAKAIMETECKNWPQMKWQFACCYAMQDEIMDDFKYDKYRRATFKKTLADHPVYDFWLTLIDSNWDAMFETRRRLPNQKMTQCFMFAIKHGYGELVRFLWNRIGDTHMEHREYIGLLQWRAFCFRCRDRGTMKFLCTKLCEINPTAVARITWSTFFDAFDKSINDVEDSTAIEQQNRRKVEFLLENCCDVLRRKLLGMENFRVISDAFRYNQGDTFALFLEYLTPEQLRSAREVLDRIHDRNRTTHGESLRRMMMRRQMTIT